MFGLYALIKTDLHKAGDGGYHVARTEDWKLKKIKTFSSLSEAEEALEDATVNDPDPASAWKKSKIYSGVTYSEFNANRNNYHKRKYFMTTPEYTIFDLEEELKSMLIKDGVALI